MSEDYYRNIFSKNLRYYMDLNRKTQIDLINDLGINKSAISTWCNGTRLPRMDKVDMLAKYFRINRSDLIEERSTEEQDSRPSYYNNPDARELAQFISENPEYKILFEASKQVKKEDIAFITEMLNRMGGNSGSDRTTDSVTAAEVAYEKALGIVPKTDSTVSNITKGTERKKQNKAG